MKKPTYLSRYLLKRLHVLLGETVLHVGAHKGQEALWYQLLLAKQVIWIEADPDIYAELNTNLKAQARNHIFKIIAKLTGLKTMHLPINVLAAGIDGEELRFHKFNNNGCSNSIFKPSSKSVNSEPSQTESLYSGEFITMKGFTLDSIISRVLAPSETIRYLVMDVQGAELICLRGATNILESVKAIEIEVSIESHYDGGATLAEIDGYLNGRRFKRLSNPKKNHQNVIYEKF